MHETARECDSEGGRAPAIRARGSKRPSATAGCAALLLVRLHLAPLLEGGLGARPRAAVLREDARLIKDMIEDWWKKNEQERMNSKMTSAAESSMSSAD